MPTISQLPAATQVNSTDLTVIVQAGVTKQATESLVLNFVQSNIQITESQVTNLTTDLASKLAASANLSDVASKSASRINLGLPALTNGQLWIGSTGVDPVNATLTAGGGIVISNAAGVITISASGGGSAWTDVTSATQVMASNNGYIADRGAGNVAFSLPATSSFGDSLLVVGRQNGWSITQGAGQQIIFGNAATTLGAGGSLASTNAHDCVTLVCSVANTEWIVRAVQGNLTVV